MTIVKETSDRQRRETSMRNMLTKLHDATIPVPDWKFTLRASGIPICQWHACLSKVYEEFPEEKPPETTSFRFDYYVSVGTAVHTVYQRWLGRLGYLYGDFMCTDCKHIVRGHLGWPEKCPTKGCNINVWEYIELKLHDTIKGSDLKSAHCDGLIRFPWMEENHYYLVDFKTCSLATLPDTKTRFTNDHHMKYLTQTGFYHYLLEKRGFIIDASLFWMIPRDNPAKANIISYNQKSMAERMYNAVMEEYAQAIEASVTGDLSGIVKGCQTQHDKPECPFNEICFNKNFGLKAVNEIFMKKHGRLPILV